MKRNYVKIDSFELRIAMLLTSENNKDFGIKMGESSHSIINHWIRDGQMPEECFIKLNKLLKCSDAVKIDRLLGLIDIADLYRELNKRRN